MEINDNNTPEQGVPTDRRPLGFWLRLVDRQLSAAFAAEFEAEGLERREWMALNLLAGDVDDERLARLAERARTRGSKVLRRLSDRGWVTQTDGTWTLTEEGRAQRDALKQRVDTIRERVAGAVSPEDYATTVASLEAIAHELGWDGTSPMPRGAGRGFGPRGRHHGFAAPYDRGFPGNRHRGFGPQFGEGFGTVDGAPDRDRPTGFGPGHRDGHGPERGHGRGGCGERPDHGHHRHESHGQHRGHGRKAERAFERGFAAGFASASRPAQES